MKKFLEPPLIAVDTRGGNCCAVQTGIDSVKENNQDLFKDNLG